MAVGLDPEPEFMLWGQSAKFVKSTPRKKASLLSHFSERSVPSVGVTGFLKRSITAQF